MNMLPIVKLQDTTVIDGNKITIVVDGIEVEGTINNRSGGDIEVEIIRPYQNLSHGSHIPYFARPYLSYVGAFGDYRLEELLTYIYMLGKQFAEVLDAAKVEFRLLQLDIQQIRANCMNRERFLECRTKLKKIMTSREIDNNEYAKRLKVIEKKYKELDSQINKMIREFIWNEVGLKIGHGYEEQIVAILKGETELFAK